MNNSANPLHPLAITGDNAFPPSVSAESSKPTIVMVHGAVEDSSLWAHGGIQGLQRDGCPVKVFSIPCRAWRTTRPMSSPSMVFLKELGRRPSETTDGAKTFRDPRSNGICLTTKRRPIALLLGDHLKPMNLNLGKELVLIGHKLLSSLTVHMGVASRLIIEGVEDEIDPRSSLVFRRVPRHRSRLSAYQLGLTF